jgi:hypothetical protein
MLMPADTLYRAELTGPSGGVALASSDPKRSVIVLAGVLPALPLVEKEAMVTLCSK